MTQSERTQSNDAQICEQYKPLVDGVVRRLHVPAALRDDARQEGFIGLLAAVRKYDTDSPVHFSLFAGPYVKGAIIRHIYTKTQVMETSTEDPEAEDVSIGGTYQID